MAIYKGDFILGKGSAVSELTLITRDPKCHVSKLEDVWRSDDTYIFGPRISHNWTIECPWTLRWVHSISECIIRIDIFCSWQNWLPDLWSEGYYCRNGQVEATETFPTYYSREPTAILFPCGIAAIRATIKHLKMQGYWFLSHSHFIFPICPVQKVDGAQKMTVKRIYISTYI